MWHVALESWQWITKWQHPAVWYVALGCNAALNSPVAAPCDVTCSSGSWHWICQVEAPCNVAGGSGMTCHGIRWNIRHIGTLHLVSILTTLPQSTCHSAQVCEILSKSDHPQQKKMTSCRFLRWRISDILDLRGPMMGSLKSRCTTSYRSSIDTISLNCLVFEKIAFLHFGINIQDGESPPSWILGANNGFFVVVVSNDLLVTLVTLVTQKIVVDRPL